MSITNNNNKNGRLCNQIIRNLALNFLAKKHDLVTKYSKYNIINDELGIILYIGKNKYNKTKNVNESNYFNILNMDNIEFNLNLNNKFFQTQEICCDLIYSYLREDVVKNNIIEKNIFNNRFNNNNDIFIHIRLGDINNKFSIDIQYYIKSIELLYNEYKNINNIYIATDSPNDDKIQKILNYDENIKLLEYDEIRSIQFGSTCKYIILSHGTFSCIIGYLGFYSEKILYPSFKLSKKWHPSCIFNIDNWECIDYK